MLRKLDAFYFRARDAWRVLTRPDYLDGYLDDMLNLGRSRAYAVVKHALDKHDPYQFDNNSFKLGYYYASEQVKAVIRNDEDHVVE
jgi:hypothetical protein